MTDIDVVTGLPKLPEGHYWAVCGWIKNSWGHLLDEPHVQISIRHKGQKPWRQAIPFTPFQKFLDALPFVPEIPHKEIDTVIDFDDEVYTERIFDENLVILHPDNLTPEILLGAAQKTLENWEMQKLSRSLMGRYPPKKLEVSDE